MSRRRFQSRAGAARLILCVLIGCMFGVGAFTFHTARGASYLSNDPAACVNCHIMRDQFDSWQKSSHHAFATCNDCHVPHSFPSKYIVKIENGFRHSWGFTFQNFHEPIQLHSRSRDVILNNCLHCHSDFVAGTIAHGDVQPDPVGCIRCHSSVGHGANP